jgi:hypothetical protein
MASLLSQAALPARQLYRLVLLARLLDRIGKDQRRRAMRSSPI